MSRYAVHVSTKQTPQSETIPGKPMVENSAGGFTFTLDDWKRLDRFLILGCEGGSYYVGERDMTKDSAAVVARCVGVDALRTINRIEEISHAGRAPKNDPAIFALAMCIANAKGDDRKAALAAVPKVCRIGTHLFQLVGALKHLTKWNRSLRTAIGKWYTEREPQNLASQIVKYQNRNGYTHRDVLRLSHPRSTGLHKPILSYAAGKPTDAPLPALIVAHELAKKSDEGMIVSLIREHGLTRESIPTEHLNSVNVWDALLEKMPMTAMIRNLAKMTAIGLIAPMSGAVGKIVTELSSVEKIKGARLHPIALLAALKTYEQGHGERGKLSWNPVSQIVDALDGAFYKAFDAVEPTGKRWLLGCDVSASMESGYVSGVAGLSPRVATGAMALVIAATEPLHHFVAFTSNGELMRTSMHCGLSSGLTPLTISPRQRLDDVCRTMAALPMGGTDCALPMIYATEKEIPVDVFVILTDNETWAGNIHPTQALVKYRATMNIPAKLVVIGMTATEFSIADPSDTGMLDVAGFDAAVPSVINEFARA